MQSEKQITAPPLPLHNKEVQVLEVAENELSDNFTDNDDFNDLYLGCQRYQLQILSLLISNCSFIFNDFYFLYYS